MIDLGLEGRTALVTGANCGIGEAIAVRLAGEGARVALTYLRLDPAEHQGDPGLPREYAIERARSGEQTAALIRRSGGAAEAMEADLRDERTPASLFDFAEAAFGPVEILILNASGWVADTFLPASADRFGRSLAPVSGGTHDRQFAVDARAGALLIAEFGRRHVSRGGDWGRIIALTSAGSDGFPQEVSYGAAKAALESYVKSAARELAPYGVTANAVHPPVTETGWVTPEVRRALAAAGPPARAVAPAAVAEAVVLLASRQARLVSANVVRLV